MITVDAIVAAAKGIETADLDGEAVLLDINTGLYYGLSSVGARIMAMLTEPTRISAVVEQLQTEYDVEGDRLRSDILQFLGDMEDRKLIQTLNGEVA